MCGCAYPDDPQCAVEMDDADFCGRDDDGHCSDAMQTCNVEADCEDCAVGSVGLGGDCTACTIDGSVANKLGSACEQCFAGKMPYSNRSGCEDCTYNREHPQVQCPCVVVLR